MIQHDQPTIFGSNVITAISSIEDGNIKYMPNVDTVQVDINRKLFLEKVNITLEQTVLVSLTYDTDTFSRYREVSLDDQGKGMVKAADFKVDALATRDKQLALFLPIADCLGAVLYDPVNEAIMVSHLGRHATEEFGAKKSVEFMKERFSSQPENLLVWFSPAAGKANYPLFSFENQSLHEVNKAHLVEVGIKPQNIEITDVDVTLSQAYFSHSEFKKGHRDGDGRFATVAMLPS